jgi:hypothetical protein
MSYIEDICNPSSLIFEHTTNEKNLYLLCNYLKYGEKSYKIPSKFKDYLNENTISVKNLIDVLQKKIDNIIVLRV